MKDITPNYSVRVAHEYNRLSNNVVDAKSLNLFKQKLDNYCGDRKFLCEPVFSQFLDSFFYLD